MNANAGYIMLIGIMLVPIVWLAWIEPGVRYALVCLAILGGLIWLVTPVPKNTPLTLTRETCDELIEAVFGSEHRQTAEARRSLYDCYEKAIK